MREEKTEEKEVRKKRGGERKRERVCVCFAYTVIFVRVLAHVCACGGQRATLGVVLRGCLLCLLFLNRVSRSLSGLDLSY